jgi:hypothetical protein
VTTAAIALFPTTASAFSSRGPLSSDQRAAVERISALKLALSERLAAQGYKFEPSPRQWARLTQKLLTPGSVVKVVAFGGSVTVGYRYSKTSYPEQFVEWLRTSFPGVDFELTNMARRATAATFAALCLVQVGERAAADWRVSSIAWAARVHYGQHVAAPLLRCRRAYCTCG